MNISATKLKTQSPRLSNFHATEIKKKLDMLDVDKMSGEEATRFVVKIWEGEALNGNDSSKLKASGIPMPKKDSFAYYIKDTKIDSVVYFQAFDPEMEGYQPMTREVALIRGNSHALKMAKASTKLRVEKIVARELGA